VRCTSRAMPLRAAVTARLTPTGPRAAQMSFLVDALCTVPVSIQRRQATIDDHTDVPDELSIQFDVAGKTLHIHTGAAVAEQRALAGVSTSHPDERLPDLMTAGLPWTGGCVWQSAYPLAGYMGTLKLRRSRVLELGAGTGMVGLAAAAAGAAEVVLTDRVVHVAQANRDTNFSPHAPITVKELCWGEDLSTARTVLGTFDVILGSDLLYLPQAALGETIHAMSHSGTQVLLTTPDGGANSRRSFFSQMSELGFDCEDLSNTPPVAELLANWQPPVAAVPEQQQQQQQQQQRWEAAMFAQRPLATGRGPLSLFRLTMRSGSKTNETH
jgi:predicted nicotinamide N-methyase